MTRHNPYTQRAITRNLKAAAAAGLRVATIKPDGTIVIESRDNPPSDDPANLTAEPRLRDAREKLGVH